MTFGLLKVKAAGFQTSICAANYCCGNFCFLNTCGCYIYEWNSVTFRPSPRLPSLAVQDDPRVWRALHVNAVWLQVLHRLLPGRQSRQEDPQNHRAHFVPQRGRRPLFPPTQWVKPRLRWLVMTDFELWRCSVWNFYGWNCCSKWELTGSKPKYFYVCSYMYMTTVPRAGKLNDFYFALRIHFN